MLIGSGVTTNTQILKKSRRRRSLAKWRVPGAGPFGTAGRADCRCASVNIMFRLVTTVRRGSASDLAAAWTPYPTIEAARVGAAALLREDRVLRVMIVKDEIPRTFVEWVER
ncbi:MAG: hypothetical protein HY655_03215 [Acidobacteria bacterium]|nr:hypothetical protein [Acidobacteriota bacterium]